MNTRDLMDKSFKSKVKAKQSVEERSLLNPLYASYKSIAYKEKQAKSLEKILDNEIQTIGAMNSETIAENSQAELSSIVEPSIHKQITNSIDQNRVDLEFDQLVQYKKILTKSTDNQFMENLFQKHAKNNNEIDIYESLQLQLAARNIQSQSPLSSKITNMSEKREAEHEILVEDDLPDKDRKQPLSLIKFNQIQEIRITKEEGTKNKASFHKFLTRKVSSITSINIREKSKENSTDFKKEKKSLQSGKTQTFVKESNSNEKQNNFKLNFSKLFNKKDDQSLATKKNSHNFEKASEMTLPSTSYNLNEENFLPTDTNYNKARKNLLNRLVSQQAKIKQHENSQRSDLNLNASSLLRSERINLVNEKISESDTCFNKEKISEKLNKNKSRLKEIKFSIKQYYKKSDDPIEIENKISSHYIDSKNIPQQQEISLFGKSQLVEQSKEKKGIFKDQIINSHKNRERPLSCFKSRRKPDTRILSDNHRSNQISARLIQGLIKKINSVARERNQQACTSISEKVKLNKQDPLYVYSPSVISIDRNNAELGNQSVSHLESKYV
jgi:hypothetical protein